MTFRKFHAFLATIRRFQGCRQSDVRANIVSKTSTAGLGRQTRVGMLLSLPGGLDTPLACAFLNRIFLN